MIVLNDPYTTPDLVVVYLFLVLAVVAWLISAALRSPASAIPAHRRLARAVGKPAGTQNQTQGASVRRRQPKPFLRTLASPQARRTSVVQTLENRLVAAALPIAATDLLAIVTLSGLGLSVLIYWFLLDNVALALGASALISVGGTHLGLRRRSERQAKRLAAQLPEAIDLIVRGVRSGLPVTEAMNTVALELAPPISTAFQNVAASVRIGKTVEQALWSEAHRLQIPEMKFFIISLSIQQETGGNLSDILENLATMIRKREQLRQKIKAMSSEARASAMIIGALPFIMAAVIYAVNPNYISGLVTDPRGWMMIAAGLTSLLIGVAVMVKMIRFEI